MLICSRCNRSYQVEFVDCPFCLPLMFPPEGKLSTVHQESKEGVSWMTQQVLAVPDDADLYQAHSHLAISPSDTNNEDTLDSPDDDLMFQETGHWDDPMEQTISQDPNDLTGRQLGNFLFVESIGEGGFGTVYRAEHIHTEQTFAIKVLHRAQQTNPGIIERFKREADTLARLQHENIVTFYDFGQLPRHGFYMVMELLQGSSLQDELEKPDVWPIQRVQWLMDGACSALNSIHLRGMIHRDLKPSNVFIHREGEREVVKLLDFGIAGLTDGSSSLTRAGEFMGTAEFVSPEQARGSKSIDGRADLYSLGTVLYGLLTKTLPFKAEAPIEIILQHIQAEPPSLATSAPWKPWCPELEEFIQTTLAKEPCDRPADARRFGQECSNALACQLQFEHLRNKRVKTSGPPSVSSPRANPFLPKSSFPSGDSVIALDETTNASVPVDDSHEWTEPSFQMLPVTTPESQASTHPSVELPLDMMGLSQQQTSEEIPRIGKVDEEKTRAQAPPRDLSFSDSTAKDDSPLLLVQHSSSFPNSSTEPVGILLPVRDTIPPQPPDARLHSVTKSTHRSSVGWTFIVSSLVLVVGFVIWWRFF